MKYNGPKCRLCRREGLKLFLKGARCHTQKCAVVRKNYAPGIHGKVFSKLSEFGKQLREKQKAKRIYGLTERHLKNYYNKVTRIKGDKSQNLLKVLSLRLDNVVYLAGFAPSRSFARQLISHGFFTFNSKRANVASISVKIGDKVELKDKKKAAKVLQEMKNPTTNYRPPAWLKVDPKNTSCEVVDLPQEADLEVIINPALIIEAYSR